MILWCGIPIAKLESQDKFQPGGLADDTWQAGTDSRHSTLQPPGEWRQPGRPLGSAESECGALHTGTAEHKVDDRATELTIIRGTVAQLFSSMSWGIRATRKMQTHSAFLFCPMPSAPIRGEEWAVLPQGRLFCSHAPLRLERYQQQDGENQFLPDCKA